MPKKAEKREKSHTKPLLIYGFLTGFLSIGKRSNANGLICVSLVQTRGEHVWLERVVSCR